MNVTVRRAVPRDIPVLDRLLYEVHRVHSDARPDLFREGRKKYTDAELEEILADGERPVFVAEANGKVLGYAFCVFRRPPENSSMTNILTLYIDDLCVDETVRGAHIGSALYAYVLDFARASGCYNVTLNVWAANPGALQFYRKIGMQIQKYGMETIL